MRSDLDKHEEIWNDLLIRTYTEDELRKMTTLIQSYNEEELKKLKLTQNLYVIVEDEDFDRSLLFKVLPENDSRIIEGKYYTPIHLVGFNIDAGLEVENIYKLLDYGQKTYQPYSPTYLPGDMTPYRSPDLETGGTKGPELMCSHSQNANIAAAKAGEVEEAEVESEGDKEEAGKAGDDKLDKYNIKFVRGLDKTELDD